MDRSNALGAKRLLDVHSFVSVLVCGDVGENEQANFEELCDFCKNLLNNSSKQKTCPEVRKIYATCSGHDWVCKGKAELFCMQVVDWKKDELVTKKNYKDILNYVIKNYSTTTAIYALDYFNRRLIAEQPHTQKIVQVAEHCVYLNYRGFNLKSDAFPVPLPGREKESNFVPFWVKDKVSCEEGEVVNNTFNPCRQAEWGLFLYEEIFKTDFVVPPQYDLLSKIRLYDIVNSKNKDFLSNVDAVTIAPDPCQFCCRVKKYNPSRVVSCSGVYHLCEFKADFFTAWPVELNERAKSSFAILSCTNLRSYRKLMDSVFSLKYFERCMHVKAHVDSELLETHPHMRKICSLYDLLLFRYYGHNSFKPEIEIVFQGPMEEESDRESDMMSDSGVSEIDDN